jgi:DNA-binding transcriptional LysR family regulator
VVRLSDLLGELLLPRLLKVIAREAPAISLDVVHLAPSQTCDALERDEIDIAVSMGLQAAATIHSRPLMRDRMVCVMRHSHPLAGGRLTLKRFLAARHLKVSMSPTDFRFIDDVLARSEVRRDIALNVPHWLLVPEVVASTDYVAVMPALFAAAMKHEPLVLRELPFASTPFDWCLYWHRRHENEAANRWLRDRVTEAVGGVRQS